VYEALIAHAEAQGENEVMSRLRAILEQEQHTLQEVEQATHRAAQGLAHQDA
jgi:ferritin-like metal-binding protein YciE